MKSPDGGTMQVLRLKVRIVPLVPSTAMQASQFKYNFHVGVAYSWYRQLLVLRSRNYNILGVNSGLDVQPSCSLSHQ